jgi:hypothetical protein
MHKTPDRRVLIAEALRTTEIPVSSAHISRLIRQGVVPAERIGGRWFISPTDLLTVFKPGQQQQ